MKRSNIDSLKELIKSPSEENNNLILKEQLNHLKKLAKNSDRQKNITQLCNYYEKKILLYHKNFQIKKIIENLSFVPLNKKINGILENKNKKINNLLKRKEIKIEKEFPCENFFQIEDEKKVIICDKKKNRPKSNLNFTIEGVSDWLEKLHTKEKLSKSKIKELKDKFLKKKERKFKNKKKKLLKKKKKILSKKKETYDKNKLTRKIQIEKIKIKNEEQMKDSNYFALQKKNKEIEKKKEKELKLKLSVIKNFYKPMNFKEIDDFTKKEDKRKKKLTRKRKKLLKLNKIVYKKEIKPLIEQYKKDKNPENLTHSLFSETFLLREKNLKRRKLIKNKSHFSLKVKKFYLPKLASSFKKNEFKKKVEIFDFEKKQKKNYENFLKIRKFGLENLKESKNLVKSFKIKKGRKKNRKESVYEKKSEKINYENYLKHIYSEKSKNEINLLEKVIKKNKENLSSKTVNKIKYYFNQYDSKFSTNRFEPKKVINSISAKIKFLERINR